MNDYAYAGPGVVILYLLGVMLFSVMFFPKALKISNNSPLMSGVMFGLLQIMIGMVSMALILGMVMNVLPKSYVSTDTLKEDIGKGVEEYISTHPQEMHALIKNFFIEEYKRRQREYEEANKQQVDLEGQRGELIKESKTEIFDFTYPNVKSSDPNSITVVEFFDYNCYYCRSMHADIQKLIEANKVNFIFREYPSLSNNSELATKFALKVFAVDPSLYLKAQQRLWEIKRPYTEENLAKIAEELNITDKLKGYDEQKVNKMLAATKELGKKLKIEGVPSFVIGSRIVKGAQSYEQLLALIKETENQEPEETTSEEKTNPHSLTEPVSDNRLNEK